jgi:hypothetical protein
VLSRVLFFAAYLAAYLFLFISTAQGFDISAYNDPATFVNSFPGNPGVKENNAYVLRWWQDMGITTLSVNWNAEDFTQWNLGQMSVINGVYPGKGNRYIGAIDCRTRVAYSEYPDWWTDLNWAAHIDTMVVNDTIGNQRVLYMNEADGAGDFFRPTWFQRWNGWDYYDTYNQPMRMHFRLTHKIVPDGSQRDTVAMLYWFQQRLDTSYRYYIRFPGIPIKLSDADTTIQYFNTHDYSIYPENGLGTYCYTRFNDGFQGYITDSTTTAPGPIGFSFPFTQTGAGTRFGMFQIDYTGHNTYYLYTVEAWDEGYHRLFMGDSTQYYRTQIVNDFQTEYSAHAPKLRSWYIDEPDNPTHRAYLAVQKLIEDHGMQGFITNGLGGNKWNTGTMDSLFYVADTMGVNVPVQMCEFYWEGGDTSWNPRGSYVSPVFFMNTDSSSDNGYINITGSMNSSWWLKGDDGHYAYQKLYHGTKSIQAGLDFSVWDIDPLWDISQTEWFPHAQHHYDFRHSLTAQVAKAHKHGTKLWALVAAGEDHPNDNNYGNPIRTPQPNEIKLTAWLAVACDADGIMWYPGLSSPRGSQDEVATWRGLLDWGTDTTDTAPEMVGNFRDPNTTWKVFRTPRYYAAKEVCHEIHQIAPIIEPLEFLGTCGSRVFEHNYSSQDTSMRLHLGAVRSYGYAPMVEDFRTWPWQNDTTGQIEERSYVQLSAWQSYGTCDDDYWFLVINRRALAEETRKIRVFLTGITPNREYMVTRFFAQTESPAIPDTHSTQFREYHQAFDVMLGPGDGELVHFAPANDIVIRGGDADTLYTPLYLNRNIRVLDGSLTIMPWPGDPASTDTVRRNPDTTGSVICWPGKGIILDTAAGRWDFSKLSIVGTHNTPVKFRSVYADHPWSGIQVRKGWADTLVLKNVLVSGAQCGLLVEGSSLNTPDINLHVSVDSCAFEACLTGVIVTTNAVAEIQHSSLSADSVGVLCQVNSTLNLKYSQIENNRHFGINEIWSGNVNCDHVTLQGNGINPTADAAINVTLSRVSLSCSAIKYNHGVGICANRSAVVMAGRSSSISWGSNDIEYNTRPSLYRGSEIYIGPGSSLSLDNGRNKIVGTGITWIEVSRISNCNPTYWTHNYWGGGENDEVLRHLPHGVVISPSLTSWQACETIIDNPTGGGEAEFVSALADLMEQQYQSAKTGFMSTITMAPDCPVGRGAIIEILSEDISSGDPSSSLQYFTAIADTSSSPATARSALSAKAWSLAYSGNPDSAQAIFETMLYSAQNYSEEAEAHLELLSLELVRQNLDTNDVVTSEELQAITDSMNYWHKWLATDLNITLKQGDAVTYSGDSINISAVIYPFNELISTEDDSIVEVGLMFKSLPDSINWTTRRINSSSSDSLYHWQVPVGRMGGLINYIFWAKDVHGRFATSPIGADTTYPDSGMTHFLSVEIGADTIRYPDSVVVWAPATITHDIHVVDGGVLVIKPWPDAMDHTVRIGDSVFIWLDIANWDTINWEDPPHSKLYLAGTEDEPLTLAPLATTTGEDSTHWGGIFAFTFSHLMAKNTIIRTSLYSIMPNSSSLVQIDSCQFDSVTSLAFISSLYDTVSYIRHSEFSRMGGVGDEENGLMICDAQIELSDCRIHDNAHEGLCIWNCANSVLERLKVDHNHGPGLVTISELSDPNISCCEFSFNGDTLPEVLIEACTQQDFGNQANCVFMDSVGPLVKLAWWSSSTNLHDGANGFYLLGGPGKYIEWVGAMDTLDISGNYWYPVAPDSSAFLSYLTPDSAAYWTCATHLDSMTMCESMEAGLPTVMAPRMGTGDVAAPTSSVNSGPTIAAMGKQFIGHAQARQDLKQAQDWEKTGNHIAAASKFRSVLSKPTNTDVTAEALSGYFMAARRSGVKTGLSSYYAALEHQLPTDVLQKQAHWLQLKSLEWEGQLQQALHGYEKIISRPETRADSVTAILSAMQLHFAQAQLKKPELSAMFPQHRVTSAPELARRSFKLVRSLYGNEKLAGVGPHSAPIPKAYKLYQNYPNPFNPVTEIRFDITEKTRVELRIFNILGQRVTTLVDEVRTAGAYRILWDGKSVGGVPVSSGMYIYQLKCDKFVDAKKMILLR